MMDVWDLVVSPSQLRGRKTEMEGGETRGGGGGQTGGIWFLWEKIGFLCTWALSGDDKYSELNGAVSDMRDERCSRPGVFFNLFIYFLPRLNERV